MNALTQQQVRDLAGRLLARYLELGQRARLAKGTLAAMAGVTPTRFSQVIRKPDAGISLYVFLRIRAGCLVIEQGLEDGTLPAPAVKGKGQQDVAAKLLAQFPDG